ncbi:MAG: hypothetical protein ABI747_01215 [Candidatus Moraniibacteriota bacterium]
MKPLVKMVMVTLLFALPALAFGRTLWPDAPDIMQPTAGQFPFFVGVAVIEALSFGIGMSFLLFGWSLVQKAKATEPGKMALFLSITWLLISWWPHDNMHRHNGMDTGGLLVIEYLFHVTLIIAAGIVAWYFWKSLPRENSTNI